MGLRLICGGVIACVVALTACGQGSSGDVRGTINIESDEALAPLTRIVAKDFERRNPDVTIVVRRSGNRRALGDLCAEDADIAGASRSIDREEARACRANGVSYGEAPVASDAVVVVLNRHYPKTCIRIEHLRQAWRPDDPIARWSEVANIELPFDVRIERFGPTPSSIPFELFTAVVNGVEGRQTSDFTPAGEDETRTIDRVAHSKGGVGYLGFASLSDASASAVTVAEIESERTGICVAPSLSSVQDGTYSPLSRTLLVYPSAGVLDDPAGQAFLEYYLEHAGEVAESVGLVPLSETQLERSVEGLSLTDP